ncbi:hypothetical protein [Rahnella perminowiae]|uniref:hypothetical protein n=1 Tax=Rahnella perminowiae TaxID=2816244 RepID=UPI00300F38B5
MKNLLLKQVFFRLFPLAIYEPEFKNPITYWFQFLSTRHRLHAGKTTKSSTQNHLHHHRAIALFWGFLRVLAQRLSLTGRRRLLHFSAFSAGFHPYLKNNRSYIHHLARNF